MFTLHTLLWRQGSCRVNEAGVTQYHDPPPTPGLTIIIGTFFSACQYKDFVFKISNLQAPWLYRVPQYPGQLCIGRCPRELVALLLHVTVMACQDPGGSVHNQQQTQLLKEKTVSFFQCYLSTTTTNSTLEGGNCFFLSVFIINNNNKLNS